MTQVTAWQDSGKGPGTEYIHTTKSWHSQTSLTCTFYLCIHRRDREVRIVVLYEYIHTYIQLEGGSRHVRVISQVQCHCAWHSSQAVQHGFSSPFNFFFLGGVVWNDQKAELEVIRNPDERPPGGEIIITLITLHIVSGADPYTSNIRTACICTALCIVHTEYWVSIGE